MRRRRVEAQGPWAVFLSPGSSLNKLIPINYEPRKTEQRVKRSSVLSLTLTPTP